MLKSLCKPTNLYMGIIVCTLCFVSADRGEVYGAGDNKMGQCGIGNQHPTVLTATKVCPYTH